MPLRFTGREARDLNVIYVQAVDAATNAAVQVKISYEAEQDYDLGRAKIVASNKYDRGLKEADGSIEVRTADCA